MPVAELARPADGTRLEHHASTGPTRRTNARRFDVVSTALTAVLILTVLVPLGRVIQAGPWVALSVILCLLLLGVGLLVRALGGRDVGAFAAQIITAVLTLTGMFFGDSAIFGFIPTVTTGAVALEAVRQGNLEIATGVAPVLATGALMFVLVAAVGIVTIILDTLVQWIRVPLVASIAAIALLAVPAIIVPDGADVLPAAISMAAVFGLLHRASTLRRRDYRVWAPSAPARMSAAVLGVLTILGTFILSPALAWVGGSETVTGLGVGPAVDDSIDLGRDLRRPREAVVLTYRSDLSSPPNLRLATLTRLIGDIWTPDVRGSQPLSWLAENPVPLPADGVAQTEHMTTVEVGTMRSDLLPVPGQLSALSGIDAGKWSVLPENRTLRAGGQDTPGQSYSATFQTTVPTAEQMRATSASGAAASGSPESLLVPANVPERLVTLAHGLTAEAETDYDRLLALQSWFRSSEFSYSLDAPVEDGFDGTSMRAMDLFLQEKAGYCVHFATAFTLMARELGMPTRVVLGFLPGDATGDRIESQTVYETTTSQLHTWPEVYFEGIGWVEFEPTQSLGTPTSFSETATGPDGAEPTASAAPAPTNTVADDPDVPDAVPTSGAAAAAAGATGVRTAVGVVGSLLVLAFAPMTVRAILRSRRRAAAGRGSATAAWKEVRATLVDHGLELDPSESPRAFAQRIADYGVVTSAQLAPLVSAIERVSYADRRHADGTALLDAVDTVRSGMAQAHRGNGRTFRALFARSLFLPNGTFPKLRPARSGGAA